MSSPGRTNGKFLFTSGDGRSTIDTVTLSRTKNVSFLCNCLRKKKNYVGSETLSSVVYQLMKRRHLESKHCMTPPPGWWHQQRRQLKSVGNRRVNSSNLEMCYLRRNFAEQFADFTGSDRTSSNVSYVGDTGAFCFDKISAEHVSLEADIQITSL